MPAQEKPTIFLAFANEELGSTTYLRSLVEEEKTIKKLLKAAETAEICAYEVESHAGIDEIMDVFQEKNGKIEVFHYGGHANSYQLLLQGKDGKSETAHAEGLTDFLSRQENLKLVFLNGCSSAEQAQALIQKGVPAVIGTKWNINDKVASLLAERFYKGLTRGLTIKRAFQEATDQVHAKHGQANLRDLYWGGAQEEPDGNPWELYATEEGKNWKMPVKNLDWLIEQQVVSIIEGIETDIDVPTHIFHQLNCDRRDFMAKCRAILRKPAPARVFVLLGAEAQQPESLTERIILEQEVGRRGLLSNSADQQKKEVFRQEQKGRLDTDKLPLEYDLDHSQFEIGKSIAEHLKIPQESIELLKEIRQENSPILEGSQYDYLAFSYRIQLENWNNPFETGQDYNLDFIKWLAHEFSEGYTIQDSQPQVLFFINISYTQDALKKGKKASLLNLFKKKKADPVEQARQALAAIDETDKKGRIIVLDHLPGVPMRDLNEWLQDYVLNQIDRTKILNTLLAKSIEEVEDAILNPEYDPEAQMDMALVEKILGRILDAHKKTPIEI